MTLALGEGRWEGNGREEKGKEGMGGKEKGERRREGVRGEGEWRDGREGRECEVKGMDECGLKLKQFAKQSDTDLAG